MQILEDLCKDFLTGLLFDLSLVLYSSVELAGLGIH